MTHANPADHDCFCCYLVGDGLGDAAELGALLGAVLPGAGLEITPTAAGAMRVVVAGGPTAFAALKQFAAARGLSIAIYPGRTASPVFRLAVMDMDSTVIRQEVIEELAAFAGVREQVERVTTAAMEGKLNFIEALNERVALLAGQPVDILAQVLESHITPSGGLDQMLAGFHQRGIRTLVVSGGFIDIVGPFTQRRGIHRAVANTLEVADGRLTGRVLGEIVDKHRKRRELLAECAAMGIDPTAAIAIGDGANDLEMMKVAGLGVAFCAKPIVQEQALAVINQQRLDHVLAFMEG